MQKKVLSLPISFFDNTKSGALVSRIMNDVEGVRNLIGTGLVQLVGGNNYRSNFNSFIDTNKSINDIFHTTSCGSFRSGSFKSI